MAASLHSDEKTYSDVPLSDEKGYQQTERAFKLDSAGLPLVPQPSDDPADPLNYSLTKKILILLLVSMIAFNTPWALATSNPAFVIIGRYFGLEPVEGGYPSTVGIAMAGLGGFWFLPFSSVYGRRPVYIVSLAVATAFTAGSGACTNFDNLIITRAFGGFALAAGPAIGGGVVSDLFFRHQRGKAAGLFTVLLTNGPHLASLPGGYLAQYVGWQWTLYLPAITTGVLLVLVVLFYPETLYIRSADQMSAKAGVHPAQRSMWSLPKRAPGRKLTLASFYQPFFMAKYWVVLAVSFYYAVVFTFGSILPALTVSKSFSQFYGFQSGRIGLCLSLSTTIGGVLGELAAGPVIDRSLQRYRARHGGEAPAEQRLWGMLPGVLLLPAGLLIFGFTIRNYKTTSYIGPCVGMALTCFAVQVVTTPTFTYLFDAYKSQSQEVAQIINFARQTLAFTVGFWASRFGDSVGYHLAGVTYAVVSLACFVPVAIVMWKGQAIRERQGVPQFNQGV